MKRRIRVADCPQCGRKTRLARKHVENGETFNFTICDGCFCVFDNHRVKSHLEEQPDYDNH